MNRVIKPVRTAAILALFYAVVAGGYILVSTSWAALNAISVESLRNLELYKGIGFVVVTAAVLFGTTHYLLNRLSRALRTAEESREAFRVSQQQALIGLLAGSVAHDLNNMLGVMRYGLEEFRDELGPSSPALQDMDEAHDRAAELADRLMRIGQTSPLDEPTEFDLSEEIADTIKTMELHRDVRHRDLHVDTDSPCPFVGERGLIRQLVMNLLLNATEATTEGGCIRVKLRGISDGAALEVHDDGPGVPDDVGEQIFEPFFSTKEDGTGLGLLSARVCAERHDGEFSIGESPLGGACVRVILRRQ